MRFSCLLFLLFFFACTQKRTPAESATDINELAEKYVKLALAVGEYDPDFVDAYFGPDSLKIKIVKDSIFPRDSFLAISNTLVNELTIVATDTSGLIASTRAKWMINQLTALKRRIRIFSGEFGTFDEESKDLFGVVPPAHPESHYVAIIQSLDSLLPGQGPVAARFQELASKFILPVKKLEPVFKKAIDEARSRTLKNYQLPKDESFTLEFVKDKPWSGYNWYKGSYKSVIQINTDLPIYVERAIDLACHEGYPGHHVYNVLLEKNLYRDSGWVEISLYPLFSPQSLIAEGSANYGIEMAFPGEEQLQFTRDVLLPLARIDTTGISFYFKALQLKSKLSYTRNEVARGIINGSMNETEALRWLTEYNLMTSEAAAKSISFIKKYRSYVINYNYGLDLVKNYLQSQTAADTSVTRWNAFKHLLSNPVTTEELLAE